MYENLIIAIASLMFIMTVAFLFLYKEKDEDVETSTYIYNNLSSCLNNLNKKFDKINKYINNEVITGIAIRDIYSFDLTIEVKDKFVIKVNRGKIVSLWEKVRYKDEFKISFILSDLITLKIISIDERMIYQKHGTELNYVIEEVL